MLGKTYLIGNFILQTTLVLCITAAAMYFNRIAILWFYLLPCFCGLIRVSDKSTEKEQKKGDEEK